LFFVYVDLYLLPHFIRFVEPAFGGLKKEKGKRKDGFWVWPFSWMDGWIEGWAEVWFGSRRPRFANRSADSNLPRLVHDDNNK
jgi:hypothetical protein